MKRSNPRPLTVAELIEANRTTLQRIKEGDNSLSLESAAEEQEGLTLEDNVIILIRNIVDESAKTIDHGVDIFHHAKICFIGLRERDISLYRKGPLRK
jgi:hypothetical protein